MYMLNKKKKFYLRSRNILSIISRDSLTEPCDPFIVPKDCADIQQLCGSKSGIYYIFPEINGQPVQVYCDMETDEGGWLVSDLQFCSTK